MKDTRTEIRLLGPDDAAMLDCIAPGTFDHAIDSRLTAEFLSDLRHHMAIALVDGQVVGMASAVHYIHPDKPPELWINEVGVAPGHQRQGIGKRLLEALLARGRELSCTAAWVLTEEENAIARRLYASAGGQEKPTVYFEFDLESI